MRKGLVAGLIAVGLMAALPAVTMAAEPPASGEPPISVPGLCITPGTTSAAIPVPSGDTAGGRAPGVFFGPPETSVFVGPLLNAPLTVFNRTGGCPFTQPPS